MTVSHLFCHKTGLSSFYGSAILTDFVENVEMDSYTIGMLKRILFSNKAIDEIKPAKNWTSDRLECDEVNKNRRRTTQPNTGYEVLQGSGVIRGRMMDACIEVLEFTKGTELWPEQKHWKDSILFFEASEGN